MAGLERFCSHRSCNPLRLGEAKRKAHHPGLTGRRDGLAEAKRKAHHPGLTGRRDG